MNTQDQRDTEQCAHDVATIALTLPPDMTSGDVLRALTRAWTQGATHGLREARRIIGIERDISDRVRT